MRRHKYNAKPVTIDGIYFASTKEGNYYCQLKLAKKSGELLAFYMQVPFKLPGKVKYLLDFLEVWKGDIIKHVDVKGVDTAISKLKRKMVEDIYQIKLTLV